MSKLTVTDEEDDLEAQSNFAQPLTPSNMLRDEQQDSRNTLDPLYEEPGDLHVDETSGVQNRRMSALSHESRYSASSMESLDPDEEVGRQTQPRRRTNLYRPSFSESLVGSQTGSMSELSEGEASRTSRRSRKTVFASRRSTTRRSTVFQESGNSTTSGLNEAVDQLQKNDNTWDSVAAAAAVVRASSRAPKRSHIQFGQNDHVLVLLTLLNVTNLTDDKDGFTVDPVNSFGYPAGEGKTEAERNGPYKFVLCVVRNVHFDEDERYYTVERLDTHSEQRADPPWMEAIADETALQAALRASKRTTKTKQVITKEQVNDHTWYTERFVPWVRRTRASSKRLLEDVLHGKGDYVVRLRFTGINLLVLCSLVFLFLDTISLAFLASSSDKIVAIIGFVVWCILVLELAFEFLLRPSNYDSLISADKAYAPSTARHINRYHLFFEASALLLFIPTAQCVFRNTCRDSIYLSGIESAISSVKSTEGWRAALGRLSNGLIFLRCFGLVRHWKQMWIAHTFEGNHDSEGVFIRNLLLVDSAKSRKGRLKRLLNRKKTDEQDELSPADAGITTEKQSNEEDMQLKNAASVGTALMLINSHRALASLLVIATLFPVISTLHMHTSWGQQPVDLLQAYNLAAQTESDCDFLQQAALSWVASVSQSHSSVFKNHSPNDVYLVWAEMKPVRCDWQTENNGILTTCPQSWTDEFHLCELWDGLQSENATLQHFSKKLGVREGELVDLSRSEIVVSPFEEGEDLVTFHVRAIFNESNTVAFTNMSLFLQMLSFLFIALIGLTVMRGDAGRLVLGPLQRMLKIVVRYAENPLSQTQTQTTSKKNDLEEELGNYETEQLINAIAKIADLLRKCWGVAGAGIISTNLARTRDGKTVVFNPTVPGKSVYALFGFVAINDFSKLLRVLDRDVMRLINDVARVVHDEVYRWALGDSGQCNKNLGSAFLMVFRIGDFMEVHEKQRRAADVVFKRQPKKNLKSRKQRNAKRRASSRHFEAGKTLQLASLPGIQSFADRALLGMLKSFASIHRDKDLKEWQKDFRLGAGVGAFKVNVIYGMDAGWAVEGAVGSEYKIDATYLSPHVNMASRMMSACKQYGVTILLSQAVEELLSRNARNKLRHLDTVYVKGSSVKQRIYTYDCRFDGVDFFLFERSPEQSDAEAAAYSPNIWETDQDLRSMRQHVTDEFMELFHRGVEKYLEGEWKEAANCLQDADDLMLRAVIEEGYVDYKADDLDGKLFDREASGEEITRIRNEFGDGACKCLVQYMKRRKCVAPSDWNGVRALMSK